MKVRDKNLKVLVDVADKDCPGLECYWPRPDPGVYTQGVGYRSRDPYGKTKPEWLCGIREIRGCPINPVPRHTPTDDKLGGI